MIRVAPHSRPLVERRGIFRGDMPQAARTRNGHDAERGAALVEFALVLPILLMVALGIIEFGFALSQQLDVRHGAREASRMVATDDYTLSDACSRINLATGSTITLAGAGGGIGDEAAVTVAAPLQELTGFFTGWLPANLTSEAKVRIEQDPNWSNGSSACP